MWWLLTQHFGLRGRQEHHKMKVEDFTLQRDDDRNELLTFAEGLTKTRQVGLSVKTRLVSPKMFKMRKGVQSYCLTTIPGEATKRNEEKRSLLPHCNRQAGFKHLVQCNKTPMGRNSINTIMKNMEKLTTEGWPTTVHEKLNCGREAEKFWYPKVWNKEYHGPRICQRAWRLRLKRRRRAADHFTSHLQQWPGSFTGRWKSTLSQLYLQIPVHLCVLQAMFAILLTAASPWTSPGMMRLRRAQVILRRDTYRILHGKCARTVFTHELWRIRNRTSEQSERVRFLIQNNECVNTVQSTFHVVLCLLYTYWDWTPSLNYDKLYFNKRGQTTITERKQLRRKAKELK